MSPQPIAREKLDAIGVEAICDRIGNGKSLTAIAMESGVSVGSLFAWIAADSERSACVRETRTRMASYWEEKAESCIADAADEFELKKARELAHHYRWRAAKIAPREYGDKLEVNNTGLPMVIIKDLSGRKDEPAADD